MKLTTKLLIVASFAVVALSFAASPAAAAGEDTDCLNGPSEFCNEDLSELAFSDDCGDCYDCPNCEPSLSDAAFECECYDCPLCGDKLVQSDLLRLDSQAPRALD